MIKCEPRLSSNSLQSPGWPQILYNPYISDSQMLGLQVCGGVFVGNYYSKKYNWKAKQHRGTIVSFVEIYFMCMDVLPACMCFMWQEEGIRSRDTILNWMVWEDGWWEVSCSVRVWGVGEAFWSTLIGLWVEFWWEKKVTSSFPSIKGNMFFNYE